MRRERRGELARIRVHTQVEAPLVFASLDSTDRGTDEHGEELWGAHLLDVATSKTFALECMSAARDERRAGHLEKARAEHGALPLGLGIAGKRGKHACAPRAPWHAGLA